MRIPLPAPTVLETWQSLRTRLHHWARQAKHAEALAELHEWYWETSCEEFSKAASEALQNLPLANANFEVLCAFDMDCGGDQSAAAHLLGIGQLSEMEIRLLRALVESRLRIMHVSEAGELGLQGARDLNSGSKFWVAKDSWPTELEPGKDYLVRMVAFPGVSLWAGPMLPLPNDPTDPLRKEAVDLVSRLMAMPMGGLRGQRESALVDFHHQWAERTLDNIEPAILQAAPFTLLRGA